ncbi:MAG TPA: Gldg family protein [Rhizomicrobium sp.]
MISRRAYAFAVLALAVILFLAVNIFADAFFTTARLDLTENGQFTLAHGTRDVIARLPEPVTLKFYYSKKVAADYASTAAYAKRVRDLLAEYAALSHGKIVLEDVDPEPFTPEEDEANAAGLTGAPTDSGDTVYFGLVGTNRIDGKEVVPYFAPEREQYLEYDITALLYRLSNPKKPVIGILTSLPMDGGQQGQPLAIYSELTQNFDTQPVPSGFTAIPANIDVLLIAQATGLSGPQLEAIDQFVLKGGRALVFVDPDSEIAQGQPDQNPGAPDIGLAPLLHAWGIQYDPSKVLGDRLLAQQVQTPEDPRNPVSLYPIWLHLTADNFDHVDPVTANLQSLNLASTGALFPARGASTKFVTLVASSDQAALLDRQQVQFNPRPQDLMTAIVPTHQHYAIAAQVSGLAHTAFPSIAPVKSGNINVIVMADSDIFDDRFWVHVENAAGKRVAAPFADNAAFVLDAVENLTGSDDLISLRTRTSADRPFTVVRALQAQAQAQYEETAQALTARLTLTQQRLQELQQGASTTGRTVTTAGLSAEQRAEIDNFKRQLIETRAQLRDVQHNLRKDIDTLGSILAFINIALVPLLVGAFALVLGFIRRRRARGGR